MAPALVQEFGANGAIRLEGVFDHSWIELLQRGVDANMASPGQWSSEYTPDGGSGRFWDDYCNWQRIDEYR